MACSSEEPRPPGTFLTVTETERRSSAAEEMVQDRSTLGAAKADERSKIMYMPGLYADSGWSSWKVNTRTSDESCRMPVSCAEEGPVGFVDEEAAPGCSSASASSSASSSNSSSSCSERISGRRC
eukprot:511518-Rhodomonas_salina.1